MSTLGMRFLLFWLPALLLAACGPEAPPRAAAPTSRPAGAQPTVGLTMARPAAGQPAAPDPTQADQATLDPRAIGDPSAPITVIEYGDYQ